MAAAAAMEFAGVPIDVPTLELLREALGGHPRRTDRARSMPTTACLMAAPSRPIAGRKYLAAHNIPWPRLDSGRLDLSDDTFRQMARAYPLVSPMRELRSALSELRLTDLAVGRDGRNRTILSAFRSRTGRNQPSNSKFIFGPSRVVARADQAAAGHGIAYIDWSQQEFGIAAVLSGDEAMLAAYQSGDPYLAFAKQAGAVPRPDATKHKTHGPVRELFKQCVLAVLLRDGSRGLWPSRSDSHLSSRAIYCAHITRPTPRSGAGRMPRSITRCCTARCTPCSAGRSTSARIQTRDHCAIFRMQGNGSEMMRLACCFATERGIEVCAPVHDAFLICAPLDRLDADIAVMRAAMAEASRIVLGGFELRTDVHVVRYPDRYMDDRGAVMWARVQDLIAKRRRQVVA